ncbi:SLBB domain-containing protein [Pseudoalteromonas xiamenensis]|uniref:SLBB domain-containing protein n=1 Tax=Pseudoalteromonas xiamenensis TaxID=882626 RepID=UPI0035E76454
MNFLRLFILSLFLLVVDTAFAASPNQQQIEQFKKLPKAQQEALAKQLGIALPSSLDEKYKNDEKSNESSILPRDQKVEPEESDLDDKFKPKKEEIKAFGYELFSGQPTTFLPTEMAPIADDYLVNIGDEVKVNLYGKTTSEFYLKIDREGRLSIPNLSPIHVIGLTFSELKELVKTKIQEEMIGVQSYLTMGSLSSMRIMIVGDAYRPGSYMVSPLATVTHALFVAGGVNEGGSLRNIQVKRGGRLIANFDLYDLLLFGDSSSDVVLKSGDVVFIPPAQKKITVKGEVNRQAIFELKESDSIESIIAMVGGLKANANKSKVVVSRYDASGRRVVVNANFNENKGYTPINGDEITVNQTSSRLQNTVTVVGAVTNPGNFQWQEGQTLQTLFSNPREDFLAIADYSYSLLIREVNLKGDIEIVQFALQDIIINKTQDIDLKSNDTLVIFSRYELKEEEEKLLSDFAFSKEQLKLQKSIQLWEQYEKQQFLRYVGQYDEEALLLEEEKSSEVERKKAQKVKSIDSLLETEEPDEADFAVFSRRSLLPAILTKLQSQSSAENPVKVLAINGKVKFPGVYPLPINPSFKLAIQAAGGLQESAYLEKVEITRIYNSSKDDKRVEHIQFNAANSEQIESLILTSKDTITIFPKPNWQDKLEVKLVGEVMFPGLYTIYRGEKLVDVIRRAGGFTSYAHKEAAIFTRESIKARERSQIQRLSEELRRDIVSSTFKNGPSNVSRMSYTDMDKIMQDLADVEALGRLVIDLDSRESLDLPLENGDALYVPSLQNSISVIGEVYIASTHIYEPGKDVYDYIRASGGFKQKADEERVYVIKANGSVVIPKSQSWFSVSDAKGYLEPGDSIVVPLDTEQYDTLTVWSQATQILSQIGLAAASLATLNK